MRRIEEMGAAARVPTGNNLPPAASGESHGVAIDAEVDGAENAMPTSRPLPHHQGREGATGNLSTHIEVPPPAPDPAPRKARGRRAALFVVTANAQLPPADIPLACARLTGLQRRRRFCIVQQSRVNRSTEAFIAAEMGYSAPRDPREDREETTEQRLAASKARKALFAKAAALRRAVEAGGGHSTHEGHSASAAACTPIILAAKLGRDAWDTMRAETEAEMVRTAKSLPAFAWVAGVAGFGALGLAIIVGETGDLANYATKERVWKRLGLAVIDGERQQRRADRDKAIAHGFAPQRRAEIWAIADAMFRHQWRGAKEDRPAQAAGPYGAVYAARKAATAGRDWTPAHRDADARRVMSKALIEDLWRVWHGRDALAQKVLA